MEKYAFGHHDMYLVEVERMMHPPPPKNGLTVLYPYLFTYLFIHTNAIKGEQMANKEATEAGITESAMGVRE